MCDQFCENNSGIIGKLQESWTTIVVHSRDDQEVGMAHEVKLTQMPASTFPDNDGAVLVRCMLGKKNWK